MKGSWTLRQAAFNLAKSSYRAKCLVKNKLGSPSIGAYWWVGSPNFGDWITPFLIEKHGLIPFHEKLPQSQLLGAGSILQDMPIEFAGAVLGSGFIRDVGEREFKNAKLLAVRGQFTRNLISNAPENITLGDPGLLLSKFLPVTNQRKTCLLGIVPHYQDVNNPVTKKLVSQAPDKIIVIDVRRSVRKVACDIASCQHIISSSLHGLVVADAYSIPNAWVEFSDKVVGRGFKFRDYYSSWDEHRDSIFISDDSQIDQVLGKTRSLSHDIVEAKQEKLAQAFTTLKQEMHKFSYKPTWRNREK